MNIRVLLVLGGLCVSLAQAQLSFNGTGTTINFGPTGFGQSFFNLTPSGGTAPYTFTVTGATIPGFRVANRPDVPNSASASATAVLIGLATSPGTYSTTIQLRDATNATVSKTVNLTVADVDFLGFFPSNYGVGDTVSFPFIGIGGNGTYTFAHVSGTLPAGIVFNPGTATVSGTLTAAQAATAFGIRVTDGLGRTFTRTFSPSVSPLRLLPASPPTPNPRILPTATQSLAYSYQLLMSGCTGGPCTFSVVPGDSLPAGLTISSSGLVSGTPTGTTFSSPCTVQVTDPSGNSVQYRLSTFVVPQTPQPLGISTNVYRDFVAGQDVTVGIYANGGVPPYTFSVDPSSSLPAGIILRQGYGSTLTNDAHSCLLRSKALAPLGPFSFLLRVQDSAGNVATRLVNLKIANIGLFHADPISAGINGQFGTPYGEELVPLGGTYPYFVTPRNIVAGLAIDNSAVISGVPAEIGRFLKFDIDLMDSGGNTFFNDGYMHVDAPAGATSTLLINGGDIGVLQKGNGFARNVTVTGSNLSNPNFTVALAGGALPPGLKLLTGRDFNNGGATANAAQIAGIPTTRGTYSFRLSATDGAGGFGQREIRVRVSDLSLANTAIAPATVGQFYSQTFDPRGGAGPYSFALTTGPLPTGLSFNTSTGAITGTPTTTSALTVGVQVSDSTGDVFVRNYTLNIYSLQITTPNVLPTVISGRAYAQAISINPPGAYTWTAAGLPAGLDINASTGVISGTVAAGTLSTNNVTVTAANAATAVVKTFTIFVKTLASTPVLTGLPTAPLGDVVAGAQLVNVLNVTGGTPPYTVSLVPGFSLPPGLALIPATQLNPTTNFGRYAIGGIPTVPGSYSFRLRYTDAAGVIAERMISLAVRTIALATGTPGLATVNQAYTAQLMGVGAAGPFNFALAPTVNNLLPPGLTLSPTGLLSGTPTSTGAFTFAVDLTAGAATRRQNVTVTINAAGTNRIDFGLGPVIGDLAVGTNTRLVLTPTGGAGTHNWTFVSGTLPPGVQFLAGASLPSDVTAPNALLAGAPNVAGDYTVRIRVDDSAGNFGIRDATVHVTPMRFGPQNQPYTFGSVTAPMRAGSPYSFTLLMSNSKAPTNFADQPGTFMTGNVALAPTGVVAGTPAESGNFAQAYLVIDANGATARTGGRGFTSYPATGPIGVTGLAAATLGDATAGSSYSFNLNNLLSPGFGVGPFNWALDSGNLPAGLGIAGSAISGVPSVAGTSTFSLVATDSQGTQHLVGALSLRVSDLSMTPAAGALPGASAGSPYSASFGAAGAPGPFTLRLSSLSDMPAGLSLSPAGLLSGTPATQGSFVLWIEAVAGTGGVLRQRYTLTVGSPGAPIPSITATPNNVSVSHTVGNPGPSPVPLTIGSTAAAFGYTATASGGPWLSVTPPSGNTGTSPTVNANFNIAGLVAGTYNGAITVSAASASNSPMVIPVTLTVGAAPVCNYTLSPGAATAPATAGGLSFDVTTASGCNWTATTADPFITVATPSGTGPGSVSLNLTANANPAQRAGAVTVQGLTFAVTQFGSACAFSISPASLTVGAGAAGNNVVTVNASSSACAWTASGNGFITVNGAAAGTGSGSVTIDIVANPGSSSRSGNATVAGLTLAVNQAGLGCTYALSSSGTAVATSGDTRSVNMIAPSGCAWTTDPGPSWISVSSGGSGSGFGTVQLSVDPNSSTATRTAQVLIGGQSYLVSQGGAPCGFSIAANNPSQPSGGGGGSLAITATGSACSWIASANAPWVTLSSTSGTGSGPVNFTVAANSGSAARSAVVNAAGQSIVVNQNGLSCSYTLQSPSANLPSGGGPSTVGVIAASGCPWTASSPAPWIQITSGAASSGAGNVGYSVDPNTTGVERSATLTIAGINFPVTEAPASCVITLGSPGSAPGEFGGPGSFSYTTSVSACAHAVQSFSSWITVTSNPYAGTNGTVNFSVSPNTYSAARSGVIRVGDREFTVTQAPSTCSYTLMTFGSSFSRMGGDGAIPMNFSPPACGPPAVVVNGPPGMITLGPVSSAPGSYAQNYTVNLYQTFINYVRTAQLLVQGQIYTVKQNSY